MHGHEFELREKENYVREDLEAVDDLRERQELEERKQQEELKQQELEQRKRQELEERKQQEHERQAAPREPEERHRQREQRVRGRGETEPALPTAGLWRDCHVTDCTANCAAETAELDGIEGFKWKADLARGNIVSAQGTYAR